MKALLRIQPRLLWMALLCLGAAGPASAGGIAPDLHSELQSRPLDLTPRRVIVQLARPNVSPSLLALAYGGLSIARLPGIQAAVLSIPLTFIDELALDSAVAWVSPDRLVVRQNDYDHQTVGAHQVWASPGYGGTGVRVAVLDSGVVSNTAEWNRWGTSTSRVVGWKDLINGYTAPYDDNGHGTHVAGALLGSGAASNQSIRGIAPDADLVAVKVLGQNGSGYTSTVIAGLDWCVTNRAAYNLRVVNLSLGQRPGESTTTDPLCAAVRRAVSAGLVVVCSAGNKGKNANGQTVYGGISSPGNEPAALTVGALNTMETGTRGDDRVASFSSRGPTYLDHWAKPDLVAPGNRIVSVRAPGSYLDAQLPNNRVDADGSTPSTVDYFRLSGTSFAAPQASGAAALLLQAYPALDPNTVKGLLTFTAERLPVTDSWGYPLPSGLSTVTQGAGSLNVVGALALAGCVSHGASAGAYWQTAAPTYSSTINARTFSWNRNLYWADRVLSGNDLFGYRQQAWSPQLFWGASTTWTGAVTSQSNGVAEQQAAWSNQAAWNDGGLWGDQSTWGDDDVLAVGDAPMHSVEL
ncbi:MAG: S8 family peptidase [Armatimonadota bacterium]